MNGYLTWASCEIDCWYIILTLGRNYCFMNDVLIMGSMILIDGGSFEARVGIKVVLILGDY